MRYLTSISLALIVHVLLFIVVLMVLACTATPATLAPTPNIDATIEARFAQERGVEATVEAKANELVADQPTPTPTRTPTPIPTLTATPRPTPTMLLPTPQKATFISTTGSTNWPDMNTLRPYGLTLPMPGPTTTVVWLTAP